MSIKIKSLLLVCLEEHEQLLSQTLRLRKGLRIGIDGLNLYSIAPDHEKHLFEILHLLPDRSTKPYLDKFYIWCTEELADKLWFKLYELIADEYEGTESEPGFIDITRNIDNYRALFRIAKRTSIPLDECNVLDFGCGSGLAWEAFGECQGRLVGYDRVPAMQAIASKRGMPIFLEAADPAIRDRFHLVIASYVFHLLSSTDSLSMAWRLLKPAGVLIANFHRGAREELVCEFVKRQGGEVIKQHGVKHRGKFDHGTYVCFRKPT